MPLRMICATCGGTNVLRDAWASWDEDAQQWELHTTFDDAHCEDCDGETSIDEEEITAEVCGACHREEGECSRDPCETVQAERGA